MFGKIFSTRLTDAGCLTPHWEIESAVQEKLIDYFKAKIDTGVSDGLTSLPQRLPSYVHRFPEEMLQTLKSHAESVLEVAPNNGAAAKFLAVEAFHKVNAQISSEAYPLLEKAMVVALNDIEICFFAYATCTRLGDLMREEALVALERMLERLRGGDHRISYLWTVRLFTTEVACYTGSDLPAD